MRITQPIKCIWTLANEQGDAVAQYTTRREARNAQIATPDAGYSVYRSYVILTPPQRVY